MPRSWLSPGPSGRARLTPATWYIALSTLSVRRTEYDMTGMPGVVVELVRADERVFLEQRLPELGSSSCGSTVTSCSFPPQRRVSVRPSSARRRVQNCQSGNVPSLSAPRSRGVTKTETGSVSVFTATPRGITVIMIVCVVAILSPLRRTPSRTPSRPVRS